MPLWLLLFMPIGLAAVMLAVHFTGGGSKPARFATLDDARARILQDVPTWSLDGGVLAKDGIGALFACPDRQCIALARAHGIGFFTRFVGARQLRGYELGDEGALHLYIDDFTSPIISMILPPEHVPEWRTHLAALSAERPDQEPNRD